LRKISRVFFEKKNSAKFFKLTSDPNGQETVKMESDATQDATQAPAEPPPVGVDANLHPSRDLVEGLVKGLVNRHLESESEHPADTFILGGWPIFIGITL
jgi:hypothetical protein